MTAKLLSVICLSQGHLNQTDYISQPAISWEQNSRMVMHIWSKLLKSHFYPHPTFLAFYFDLNFCLWHCPNLAVFLTFSILFGPWPSSLISSQLTLLPGVPVVFRDSHCFTLSPSLLLPASHFMAQFAGFSLHSNYGWDQPFSME